MMSQAEYERIERERFNRDLDAPKHLGHRERKENRSEFREDCQERPDIVAERVSWLIAGNYGYGCYQQARLMLENKRMNRRSWFCQIIAALEWQITRDDAIKVWKELTKEQRDRLDGLLDDVVINGLRDMEQEGSDVVEGKE